MDKEVKLRDQEDYEDRPENLDPNRLLIALPGWTFEGYLTSPPWQIHGFNVGAYITKEYRFYSPAVEEHRRLRMIVSKGRFELGPTDVSRDKEGIILNNIQKIAVKSTSRQIIITADEATCTVYDHGLTAYVKFGKKVEGRRSDIRVHFSL